MSSFSYATDANIKRFQNLLDTSIDSNERRMIQRLLTEEKAKAETTDTTKRETDAARFNVACDGPGSIQTGIA